MKILLVGTVLMTLLGSLFGWKLADKAIRGKVSRIPVYAAFAVMTLISGMAVRIYQYNVADDLLGAAVLKFCASLPTLLLG